MAHLPESLFFDLDGTLFDSLPGIAFSMEQAFTACKLPMQRIDLAQTIGPPIRTILLLAAAGHLNDTDLDLLEAAFRKSYDSVGWQKTLLFPGSSTLLREAKALGIRLFVVSNKPRQVSANILDREGILPLFTEVLTRDSSDPPFAGKAEMIAHLLNMYQLDAGRCVMVGDTTEDAHAAAAVDVPFAWVAHGYGRVPASMTRVHRIDSFPELLTNLVKELS